LGKIRDQRDWNRQQIMRIAGVILAGGTSRRMGGREKAFLTVGGVPLLARIAHTLAMQSRPVVINASGDLTRFAAFGLDVIADTRCQGPMMGLAGMLDWFAEADSEITHVLSVPSDTPFLPDDLGNRLAAALTPDSFAACAASGGRPHPVIGLWPLASRQALHAAVVDGILSFHAALQGQRVEQVEWPVQPRDPFFNVNTPQDLAAAEAMCLRHDGAAP
jgi:molybdopterin-guanine dinucleotide biosynthesis protein A